MTELLAFSQSSLLLSPHFQLHSSRRVHLPTGRIFISPICSLASRQTKFSAAFADEKRYKSMAIAAGIVSDAVPSTFTVDSAGGGIDILPDSGGSDDNLGGLGGNGGGGGGGGGNDENEGAPNEGEDPSEGKKKGMSMSQKLTLGYAALVGIGGLMGYIKGGSQKSLIAGGVSALLLYLVYTILPSNPMLASSIGLGLSASLLGVMGSRFKKSGKIFPAGVVSFVSLIMTGGYFHGILRGLH